MRLRPFTKLIHTGIAILAIAAASSADTPSAGSNDLPARLDELIHQLGTGDWTARQRAEDQITALGPEAADAIQARIERVTDIEVRDRLRAALKRIGRDELMGPTLVSLADRYQNAADVFDVLARAVGVTLEYENDAARTAAHAARPLSFDVTPQPWLAALVKVTTETGINVRVDGERLLVLERPHDNRSKPILHVAGAMALRVDRTVQRKSLDLATDLTSATTSFIFQVMVEPKVRIRDTPMMMVSKLRDESDRDLIDPRYRHVQLTRTIPTVINGSLMLSVPPDARRINVFEGDVLVEVITRTQTIHVSDLTSLPMTFDSMGGEIVIDTIAKAGDGWELQFRMSFGMRNIGGNVMQRDSSEALRLVAGDALRVLDQNGKPIRTGSPEVVASVDGGVIVRLRLHATGDARPASIEWTLPAQARQVRQPFRVTDLPLP